MILKQGHIQLRTAKPSTQLIKNYEPKAICNTVLCGLDPHPNAKQVSASKRSEITPLKEGDAETSSA